jgi:hypothetical protein
MCNGTNLGTGSWDLPNLVNLSIESDFRERLAASSFFTVHGRKLISLMVGPWSMDAEFTLMSIIPKCPSLQQLQFISTLNPHGSPCKSRQLESSEINLLLRDPKLSRKPSIYSNRTLMRVFTQYSDLFEFPLNNPTILSIKLSNFPKENFVGMKWKKYQTVLRWQKWLDEWEKEGVRLEDANGDLLRIPEEALNGLEK